MCIDLIVGNNLIIVALHKVGGFREENEYALKQNACEGNKARNKLTMYIIWFDFADVNSD